jgi:hypothetical protein
MVIDKIIKATCSIFFIIFLSSCVTYVNKGYKTNNQILFYESDNKGNFIEISNSIYVMHYSDVVHLFNFDMSHDRDKYISVRFFIKTNNYSNVQFIQINEMKVIINDNTIDIFDDIHVFRMKVENNILQSFPKLENNQVEQLDDNRIKIRILPNDIVGIGRNHDINIDYLRVKKIKVIGKYTIIYNDRSVENEFEKIFKRRTTRKVGIIVL